MRRLLSTSVSSVSVRGPVCVNVEVARLCRAACACSCCLRCCWKSACRGCLLRLTFFLFHRRSKFHERLRNGHQSWCLCGSAFSFWFVLRVRCRWLWRGPTRSAHYLGEGGRRVSSGCGSTAAETRSRAWPAHQIVQLACITQD